VNCIGPKALYIDIMIVQNGSVKTEVVKDLCSNSKSEQIAS